MTIRYKCLIEYEDTIGATLNATVEMRKHDWLEVSDSCCANDCMMSGTGLARVVI